MHFSLQLWSPVTAHSQQTQGRDTVPVLVLKVRNCGVVWGDHQCRECLVDCRLPPSSHISHTAFSRPTVPVYTVTTLLCSHQRQPRQLDSATLLHNFLPQSLSDGVDIFCLQNELQVNSGDVYPVYPKLLSKEIRKT